MLQTISIIVKGRVQGVFFRQSTKEIAQQLNIRGSVKNVPAGNVEIVATGTKEQLNKFTEWCKKGPPRAVVTGVDVEVIPLKSFQHFMILR